MSKKAPDTLAMERRVQILEDVMRGTFARLHDTAETFAEVDARVEELRATPPVTFTTAAPKKRPSAS